MSDSWEQALDWKQKPLPTEWFGAGDQQLAQAAGERKWKPGYRMNMNIISNIEYEYAF